MAILVMANLLIALVTLALPVSALATTFTVTTVIDTDDGACTSSHCSLTEAVNAANANPGPDLITFRVSGTIFPTEAYTLSDPDTTITGRGRQVVVDGSQLSSPNNIFQVLASSAIFGDFTIQNAPNNGISVCTGVAGCPNVAVTDFRVARMVILNSGERGVSVCCAEKRTVWIFESTIAGRGGIAIHTHRPSLALEVQNRRILIIDNPSITGSEWEGIVLAELAPGGGEGSVLHEDVRIADNGSIAGGTVGIRIDGTAHRNVGVIGNGEIIGSDGVQFTGVSLGPLNFVSENNVTGLSTTVGTGILLLGADDVFVSGNEVTDFSVGIAVQAGSNDTFVLRNVVLDTGTFDLLWDGTGSGNTWRRNECDTSQPASLCAQ